MSTVRELISDAYMTSGLVGYGESIEGLELEVGLKHLNSLISKWQNEDLLCYTTNRLEINVNLNKSDISIGDYNAIGIKTIEDDGFKTQIELKSDVRNLYNTTITPSGLINYTEDRPVLSVLDNIVITAPQEVPVSEDVMSINVSGDATIMMVDTSSFVVGDNVICTDKSLFTIQGQITAITSTEITISDGNYIYYSNSDTNTGGYIFKYVNRIEKDTETIGYVYDNSLAVADIIQPRPNELNRVLRKNNTSYFELNLEKSSEWNYNDNQSGLEPCNVTYYTDYPFGIIRFDANVNTDLVIEYNKLLDQVVLDDEINLPHAYRSMYEYNLAVILSKINGKNPSLIIQDAINFVEAIRDQNLIISTINQSVGGHYDINTNRYR